MSTAVLESPVMEAAPAPAPAAPRWTMPPVRQGMIVSWRPSPDRPEYDSIPCYVQRVKANSIDVKLFAPHSAATIYQSVKHATDPFIKEAGPQCIAGSGVWDYTEESKREAEYRSDLEARLARMEDGLTEVLSLLTADTKKSSKKDG